jgi:hypothetical protein
MTICIRNNYTYVFVLCFVIHYCFAFDGVWSGPLKAIVLLLLLEIISKYYDYVFSNSCIDICRKVSDLILLLDYLQTEGGFITLTIICT